MVFSYHYKYEKYLRDNNLIDPDRARLMQAREKKKAQLNAQQKGAQPIPQDNGEELSVMDNDESYQDQLNGKYRFDQLIKTMIARIEYNNTLAPVQEYGRHQTKAAKKKKGKKEEPNADPAAPPKQGKKDFDERFYDLDDNFIDDDEMEDGYNNGLNMGTLDYYEDEADISATPITNSHNVEYDPERDAMKQSMHEEKRYQVIVKKFRVIQPDEIERMLNNKEMTPAKGGPPLGTSPSRGNENSKKRSREEMLAGGAPLAL